MVDLRAGHVLRSFAVAGAALVTAFIGSAAYADVVSSLPGGGWSVLPETTAGGAAAIVAGPDVPPAGIGSLQLSVAAAEDRALVGTDLNAAIPRPWAGLAATYSTYIPAGSPPSFNPTLRFPGFQIIAPAPLNFTTLSFEPVRNGTVIPGQWQTWTLGPTSVVWQSNAGDGGFCIQSAPCTLAEFVLRYPVGAWGQAQLGIGSGVAGPATGYADAVTIQDGATTFVTDFDPLRPPGAPPVVVTPGPDAPPSLPPGDTLPVTGQTGGSWLAPLGAAFVILGTALVVVTNRSRSGRPRRATES